MYTRDVPGPAAFGDIVRQSRSVHLSLPLLAFSSVTSHVRPGQASLDEHEHHLAEEGNVGAIVDEGRCLQVG